jgi:hypothetical protein
MIVTATGWGLNPDEDAIYLNVTPGKNDGTPIYALNVKDVPVDGFWSISFYDAMGFFEPNAPDGFFSTRRTVAGSTTSMCSIELISLLRKLPCSVR